MIRPPGHRVFLDDFLALHVEDVRRQVGGRRRLALIDSFTATLPDYRQVHVALSHPPGRLGGRMTLIVCPTCARSCRKLLLVPWSPGLSCIICVRRCLNAKYFSETLWRHGQRIGDRNIRGQIALQLLAAST